MLHEATWFSGSVLFFKKLKLNKKLWGLVFNLLSFILKLKTRIFLKKDNACEAIEH